MYYPDELIREIREANDIVGVISQYMSLTKRGNGFFWAMPVSW